MSKQSYHQMMYFITGAFALLLIILLVSSFAGNESGFGVWAVRILIIAVLVILATSLLGSINEVGPNEIGVVTQFGKPIFQTGPGAVFIPFPFIWTLIKEPGNIIDEKFPDQSKDNIASPIQIVHGTSFIPSSNPLDRNIATNVEMTFRYRIVDLSKLLSVIGTKHNIRSQIREILITTIQSECSNKTLKQNFDRINELNTLVKNDMKVQTNGWGIEVSSVQVKFIIGDDIKNAMNSVSTSAFDALSAKNKAQAQLYYGLTEAEIEKAFLYARAQGYKKIAQELNVADPIVILQIDTLSKMWKAKQANLSLYGGTLGDVFKAVTMLGQAMKGGQP